eukprot:1161755-Pelagomonas_calceolata.AAC.9
MEVPHLAQRQSLLEGAAAGAGGCLRMVLSPAWPLVHKRESRVKKQAEKLRRLPKGEMERATLACVNFWHALLWERWKEKMGLGFCLSKASSGTWRLMNNDEMI